MKRILTLLFTATTITISACQEKMKKYEWIPTECAPKNYPVQIYKGIFYYGTDKKVNVPDGRVVNYGWGENGSINLVGEKLKEAPTRLEIAWISFAEKKNYAGKFELDTKKIDSLLEQGYADDTEDNGKGIYNYIKVGMAPGGELVIWLTGVRNKQIEVGHFKANPVESLNWKQVYPNLEGSFDTYIENVLKELPEESRKEITSGKIPFGYWESLRKRYTWKVVVKSPADISRLDLYYVNKERDFTFGAALKSVDFKASAIVEELSVYWLDQLNRELRTEIKFDELETKAAFEKIKEGESAELIVNIDPQKKDTDVILKTPSTTVTLKNIKFQSFYQ